MRISRAVFFGLAGISVSALLALGQDSPSLGDVARQSRQKTKENQSSKDPAKSQKVITNEELPAHSGPAVGTSSGQLRETNYSASSGDAKLSAEQFKSHIQSQKNLVNTLQGDIDKTNDSIHFAPANCVSNCVQWNERQKDKQQRVEQMKAQLEDQKKRLEDMQESARKQGYGSAVYDP